MKRHIEGLSYLGSHLAFDSENQAVETFNHRVGEISVPLTRLNRMRDPLNNQSLVCIKAAKNLQIPENELYVLILAGIISTCQYFRVRTSDFASTMNPLPSDVRGLKKTISSKVHSTEESVV